MSKSKHTLGPWEAQEEKGRYTGRIFAGSVWIADVHSIPSDWEASWEANARLIAAAPLADSIIEAILAMSRNGVDRHDWVIEKAREYEKLTRG